MHILCGERTSFYAPFILALGLPNIHLLGGGRIGGGRISFYQNLACDRRELSSV